MVKLPNLPEKEEFEFKEKEFFLSLYEQFQNSRKVWLYILLVVLILAIPAKIILQQALGKAFVSRIKPIVVNLHPYTPQDLKILKAQILPVVPGVVSAYAQILNPNPDISADRFDYSFVLKDATGLTIATVPGESYLLAGDSKFLLLPTVNLSVSPVSVELVFDKINWTKRVPEFDVKLDVLQKNSGTTPEGKFFVEGLVRNLQGINIKRVEVEVLVFDKSNQNIIAVNYTYFTDLIPLESRYFRVTWPAGEKFPSFGQIQIIPSVNLLQPGLTLERPEKIPPR